MFRPTDPQGKLFSSFNLLSTRQETRLSKTWAHTFREKALPLIHEKPFADMYHKSQGAPNKPIRQMVGFLILKDMFDYTDEQALDAALFDVRWQVALDLDPTTAYCSQKTVHNFRVKLIEHQKGLLLFQDITQRIIEALGLSTDKQRLDSTHIRSNMAELTRLGICCETIRLFLKELKRYETNLYERVPETLRKRYLKDDQSRTRYEDVKRGEAKRRLPVAGRDLYRLRQLFENEASLHERESVQLLIRVLDEQFEIVDDPRPPSEGDADAGEEAIPIEPKKQSPSDSLQSPHEPDATYGVKGSGYEAQIAETHGNKTEEDPKPEMITHARVSDSCDSDIHETMPAINELAERGIQPKELQTDANFTSSEVVLDAEEKGTEIVGPVKGGEGLLPGPEDITIDDFQFDKNDLSQTRCPNGKSPIEQIYDPETGKLKVFFDENDCQACPQAERCPAKPSKSPKPETPRRFISTDIFEHKLEQRRRVQTTDVFKKRYAIRAGVEATNSELKRTHGMGRLRVRRRKRVELAVFLKVLACNVKRFVGYHVEKFRVACRDGMPTATAMST